MIMRVSVAAAAAAAGALMPSASATTALTRHALLRRPVATTLGARCTMTAAAADDTFPFRSDLLTGRKCVVTGGNDGIGVAITCALVRAGAAVAVVARNRAKFDQMVQSNPHLGSADLAFFAADLSDAKQTIKAAKEAVDWADGHIGVLVNNAGIAMLDPLTSLSVEAWDMVMAVNARAPFLMAQACAPGMITHRAGKIINISSQAGTIGLPDHGAYCASKAAIDAVTRVMTAEWAQHNIQCNSIAPTVVMTDMGKRVWGGAAGEPMRKRTPVGRFAEPYEIANMVVYLSSDASNILCGQTLLMEGGITSV